MHKSTRKMLFERLLFFFAFLEWEMKLGQVWRRVWQAVNQSMNQSINQSESDNQSMLVKCYINISCVLSFSNFFLVALTYLIEYHITNYKRTLGFRERTKLSSSSESSQTKGLM